MKIQDDLKTLYQMLFEIALGNFKFQTQNIQSLEVLEIIQRLNEITDQIQELLNDSDLKTSFFSYQTISQAVLLLDYKLKIKSFNGVLLAITEYDAVELLDESCFAIIADQSAPFFKQLIASISEDENMVLPPIHLILQTKKGKLVPTFCTLTRLHNDNEILINSITTTLQELVDETIMYANRPKASETLLIRKIFNFIIENLSEPLPPTVALAKRFGTNACTLKEIFRQHSKKSIYQFYTQERLKIGHKLITTTNIPLQEVAFLSGYNEYPNFYKAFKKYYNYTPNQLKRPEIGDDED